MGLASLLLGEQNPFAQWAGQNQNLLAAIGGGLGQGQNIQSGLSAGLAQVPHAKALDYQANEKIKADQKVEAQMNATTAWLAKTNPDLAQMVEAGMPVSEAWQEAMRRMQPQTTDYPAEYDLYRLTQSDPGFADFLAPRNQPDAPSGYQWSEGGQLAPIPGGPADPANPMNMKRVGQGPMSPTTQKELFEAEDGVNAGAFVVDALDQALQLNDSAYEGPFADVRGDAGALMGDQSGVATAQLKNLTTELALNQLKATFGAAPTEGERQILMELQGSVTQPKAVRERIFKRAKELALRRIELNKRKAESLRSGEYFEPGYGAAPAGDVDSILSKYGL